MARYLTHRAAGILFNASMAKEYREYSALMVRFSLKNHVSASGRMRYNVVADMFKWRDIRGVITNVLFYYFMMNSALRNKVLSWCPKNENNFL